MQSTIRLFKALPVEVLRPDYPEKNEALMKRTLESGFIFAPEVLAEYKDTVHLVDLVNKAYGRNPEELNQTFHKSWAKVRDASEEQLVFEQMIHYLTTYGAESLGIYSADSVYIPGEELNAPSLSEGIRLVVIHGLTKQELKQKLMELLRSGVALHEKTVADVIDVATFVELSEDEINQIKNKEVKSALYDYFGIVPSNPTEFLRYVVYRATSKTLLIKNGALVSQIKGRDNVDISRYFDTYEKEMGLQHLAEIFYRYKPIFLAFRTNTKLKKTINKIRRLAVVNHQPMKHDLLNDVTAGLARGYALDAADFQKALDNANTFRKIRLAYALKFRLTGSDSILYRVRNGKSYAKSFSFDNVGAARDAYDTVMQSVAADLSRNVAGKKIFIPTGVKYAMPATEKQFTGNLPSGSYVEVAEDMIVGVHWENQPRHRIDLDLSIQNAGGKIGWDGSYRDNYQDVHFSGDVTDAPKPKGASELFHIGKTARGSWIMFVNYYNFDSTVPVPFKIVVGHDRPEAMNRNYTIDPNNILVLASSEMDVKQKNLGFILADDESCKFYFAESSLGNKISARGHEYAEQARKYLLNYYTDSIVLNDVLVQAGAELVLDPSQADVDLTPESLDKTTILSLLQEGSNAESKA